MTTFNKNDKQHNFNQIKGKITELNDGVKFCSITLSVGHERPREVNLIVKKEYFPSYVEVYKIGDKVAVHYYLTSRKKEGRWSTMSNVLTVEKVLD